MGLGAKKQAVMQYNAQGLPLNIALLIARISKHQYYYRPKKGNPGRKPTQYTKLINRKKHSQVSNNQVVGYIKQLQSDPD